jgi:hypothetical protein
VYGVYRVITVMTRLQPQDGYSTGTIKESESVSANF